MTHILHISIVHKTASLADEGNSAYWQSSGAHNIKHKHRTRNFLLSDKFQDFQNSIAYAPMFNTDLSNTDETKYFNQFNGFNFLFMLLRTDTEARF